MAYQGSGTGGILLIETTLVPGGKGRLVLTGSLGDVIKESAELGLTWVKSRAMALGITSAPDQDPLKGVDLHVYFHYITDTSYISLQVRSEKTVLQLVSVWFWL
jgi:ATP-dependent Lon protease